MNFNNFTIKAQEAVQTAQQIAQQYGHRNCKTNTSSKLLSK